MNTWRELTADARRLARLLKQTNTRIVLAESCTGGLVSAALTRIPGISKYHCGSAVVYRIGTKNRWLGIARSVLEQPGPVSREVAALMAESVLQKTPEADVAASVTGHLGPDAPPKQDGLIYVGITARDVPHRRKKRLTVVKRHWLQKPSGQPSATEVRRLRDRRQIEAARFVLGTVRSFLDK